MKRLAAGIFSATLILGAGTAVFAAGTNNSDNGLNFEKMLPFMQKMHPDSSKQELKDMYKACHGKGGMMDDSKQKEMKSKDMMNSF
ncbi:hypothetical protein ABES02_10690 [Neobacillus pocheonensis]|uniref:hypothetical protein n=1 Tax=Neobacillus pocheonensis TaxID=363869 RepID=UPI003D2DB2E2